ncbi:MAG TPA: gephyrin-like molybdotransferase Glp [Dinghuibacter sp.]|uniref:molybdopterin molybdotransferase MoeA n=1 Tax=Dinghuibacter sp. TaxID=2024697 RepID=UPI002C8137A9|nr:gephyrin-like molybdotransferase Glp [Dinghuibacter sp.]HTJ10606.1 gephyrin-like molybdotransferase Glp [Dinghuibacter sp.]
MAAKSLISVDEALALIRDLVTPLSPVWQAPAVGRVLADDVYAPIDLPGWPQASMDGYAFAWESHAVSGPDVARRPLRIIGEVPAGAAPDFTLGPGEAARIFTGAMMPSGADTLVIQERVTVMGNRLTIEDAALQPGANVRPAGSEIPRGALALPRGHVLNPASIGFLASLGLEKAMIHPAPRVGLITTGNELTPPGEPLQPGRVYESNSFALKAALEQTGTPLTVHRLAPDEPAALEAIIRQALGATDVLLLTGGVSVGDYDFVARALDACKVQSIFHGVRQRPGKPFYFGVWEKMPVFGLPGNPSSVLTCFYVYVLEALGKGLRTERLALAKPYRKAGGLTHFLKGAAEGGAVEPLGAQESYRMSTYARANCLIRLPEEGSDFAEGTLVDVYPLP